MSSEIYVKEAGERELDKGGQKVQMSTYKISKYWDVRYNIVTYS